MNTFAKTSLNETVIKNKYAHIFYIYTHFYDY